MKVLLITQYFPPEAGAAQTRLAMMVREFEALGHEIDVLTCFPNYPKGQIFPGYKGFYNLEINGKTRIHRVWLWGGSGKGLSRLLCYLSFMMTSFFGLFVVRRPNLVFVNSGPLFLAIPGAFFSWWYKAPFVLQIADLWPRSVEALSGLGGKVFGFLGHRLEAWSYRRADILNAITDGVADILRKEKQVPPEKLLFYPNGVDLRVYRKSGQRDLMRARYGYQDSDFIFIYPGNHGNAHALEHVLYAAQTLQERAKAGESRCARIQFLFIGDGSEKPKLLKLKEKLNLQNVQFHDPVPFEKLPPFLEMSNAGLIHLKDSPLALETRPAKMFPLMAMSLPLLYCGQGEGARFVERIQGGVVIPSENSMAMVEAALRLSEEDVENLRRGQSNREFVEGQFSFEKLTLDWWHQFLNSEPGQRFEVTKGTSKSSNSP